MADVRDQPLFALAGFGVPTLRAPATRQVAEDRQGPSQGVPASVVDLASIAAIVRRLRLEPTGRVLA